jgi:hypothetical protein
LNENNEGHVNNSRWHVPDNVPFQTSFQGSIEKYYPNEGGLKPFRPYALYAATVFWYLAPGGTDPYGERPASERVGYWVAPPIAYREADALEAESLKVQSSYAFRCKPGIMTMWRFGAETWSGERQLIWGWDRSPKENYLELSLPVEKAGRYRLVVRCTKGPEYGKFQWAPDGRESGEPVDYYAEKVEAAAPQELGMLEVAAGVHTLRIGAAGINPNAKGKGLLGLDYLKLIVVP